VEAPHVRFGIAVGSIAEHQTLIRVAPAAFSASDLPPPRAARLTLPDFLTHGLDQPERYGAPTRFDTMPSQPSPEPAMRRLGSFGIQHVSRKRICYSTMHFVIGYQLTAQQKLRLGYHVPP
jgi:hypothetical protein